MKKPSLDKLYLGRLKLCVAGREEDEYFISLKWIAEALEGKGYSNIRVFTGLFGEKEKSVSIPLSELREGTLSFVPKESTVADKGMKKE